MGGGGGWVFLDLTDTLLALIFSVKLRSFNVPIRSTGAECINVNYIPRNTPRFHPKYFVKAPRELVTLYTG